MLSRISQLTKVGWEWLIRTPAPARGEHSVALLRELGLDADEIEDLKEKGVVEG